MTAVAEAAKILDDLEPNWFLNITEPLEMGSLTLCVLGQVYGQYYFDEAHDTRAVVFERMPWPYRAQGLFSDDQYVEAWEFEVRQRSTMTGLHLVEMAA